MCEEVKKGDGEGMDWLGGWVVGGSSTAGERVDDMGAICPHYVGLVMVVDAIRHTVIFEWVGRQVRIKTTEVRTHLVMLQVRDKVTGRYMQFADKEARTTQFQVEFVARVTELEGRALRSACQVIRGDTRRTEDEGVSRRRVMCQS